MKKSFILFLVINATVFYVGCQKARAQATESIELMQKEPEKVEAETVPYTIIEGYLLIRNGHLFLSESGKEQKLYRITGQENFQVYSSLFSLVKERVKENKGLKAVVWGEPGRFAQIIEEDIKYTDEGYLGSHESKAINFIDFAILRTEKTFDVPLKEIKTIDITSPAYAPIPLPTIPMIKSVQGEVVATYFNKVIPYIEIRDKATEKSVVIIIPSNIKVIKIMEGQLMGFSPKNIIKAGSKLEIWYEEKGDINTAQTITMLPE